MVDQGSGGGRGGLYDWFRAVPVEGALLVVQYLPRFRRVRGGWMAFIGMTLPSWISDVRLRYGAVCDGAVAARRTTALMLLMLNVFLGVQVLVSWQHADITRVSTARKL